MKRETEIRIEKEICKKLVDTLLARGFELSVYDGEDFAIKRSTDAAAIMSAVFSTDEDYIFVYERGVKARFGWVHLVWGNVEDIISDYTTNLDTYLDEVNTWIMANRE